MLGEPRVRKTTRAYDYSSVLRTRRFCAGVALRTGGSPGIFVALFCMKKINDLLQSRKNRPFKLKKKIKNILLCKTLLFQEYLTLARQMHQLSDFLSKMRICDFFKLKIMTFDIETFDI